MNITGIIKSAVYSYFGLAKPGQAANSSKDDGSIWDWLTGGSSYIEDSVEIPTPTATGCSGPQATATVGAHLSLTGDARTNWDRATEQVLRSYCGLATPSSQQIQTTRSALVQVNERHLKNDVSGVISYNLSTPRGVDHRIGQFLYSDTEIFVPLPAAICPAPVTPVIPPAPPPTQQPDAATTTPDVTPPPPAQTDVGTPDVAPPPTQDVATPEVPAVNQELEQAKQSLTSAISRTGSLISRLNETGDQGMKTLAASLRQKKNTAQQALDSGDLSKIQAALQELNSARRAACSQYNTFIGQIGGEPRSCQ